MPHIEQLPVELLAKILHLALPPIDVRALEYPDACTDYMHSLYELQLVSNPTLETMHLRCSVENPAHEPFPLLGHHVSNIRYVNLTLIAFHPSPSPFHSLTDFSLCSTWADGITAEWIIEVLRESPQLERLRLANLNLQIPTFSEPMAAIDLLHLKSFRISGIDGKATDYVIRLIKAPNCIQFQLDFNGRGAEDYNPSLILDNALTSFEPIFQSIVHALPRPFLSIEAGCIFWGRYAPPDYDPDPTPFFHLSIRNVPFLAIIRWLERVVDPTRVDRGPDERPLMGAFYISSITLLTNAEIASRLKHLKS
ncbi:hypothetical protein FRC00_006268, partial [Tulasnella sp. 408]